MKINKINYVSAVYFLALSFVLYLIIGVVQLIAENANPGTFSSFGLATPTFLSSVIYAPLTGGLIGCLFALLSILVYNIVAKKYPISIELSKK